MLQDEQVKNIKVLIEAEYYTLKTTAAKRLG